MRAAVATIDLDAVRHNYRVAKSLAPNSKTLAVVKADAYGHGLVPVAAALQSIADGYMVCSLEEGRHLRQAGIKQSVMCVHGAYSGQEFTEFAELDLQCVLHSLWQFDALEKTSLSKPLKVWLKLDTGMGRLGLELAAVPKLIARIKALSPHVELIGLLSHLSNAEDAELDHNQQQLDSLLLANQGFDLPLSLANSASLYTLPASRLQSTRPGIVLYGVSPLNTGTGLDLGLKPAMTLTTRLFAINQSQAGDSIGYGRLWQCPENMPVGIAAIGFGDGYPRCVSHAARVLINGQYAPIIGRISMDSIALDLRGIDNLTIGNEITLWGNGLPVEEIAAAAGTIGYELLCSVSRIKHVYNNADR